MIASSLHESTLQSKPAVDTQMTGNPAEQGDATLLDEEQVMKGIRQAIDSFDSIFAQIAPCRPRRGSPSRDDATEQMIAASILNDHQKTAVAQLSGHLMSLHDLVYNVTLQRIHQSSELSHLPMHLPTRCEEEQAVEISPAQGASSSDDANKKVLVAMQKLRLLQEYLVNELVHSEQLEEKLKKAEHNLLKITDERDNLVKRLAKANNNNNNNNSSSNSNANQKKSKSNNAKFTSAIVLSSSSGTPTRSSTSMNKSPGVVQMAEKTPVKSAIKKELTGKDVLVDNDLTDSADSLVGRYIRKTFDGRKYFGLVASFTSPYFMVVYEDGDNEELKRNEVTQVLWYETVPTSRVASCERHKRRLLAQLNDDDESVYKPTDSSVAATITSSSTPSILKRQRTDDSDEHLPFDLVVSEANGEENPSHHVSSSCASGDFGEPKGFFFEDAEETKLKQAIVNELLAGFRTSK